MREKMAAGFGFWRILVGAESYVSAQRVRAGVQVSRGLRGTRVGMYANWAEVVAKT